MAKQRFGPGAARATTIVVGTGYLVAAGIAIAEISRIPPFLRTYRWPFPAASAAQLGALGLFALAGAFLHPAARLAASVVGTAFLIGNYGSDSVWAPLVLLSVAALAFAYVRSSRGLRSLGVGRLVVLALAVIIGLAGIIAMQGPKGTLQWQRLRRPGGRIELHADIFETACGAKTAPDAEEIDSGCDAVIPARRAGFVIGYSAGSALFGIAAVAGARRGAPSALPEPGPRSPSPVGDGAGRRPRSPSRARTRRRWYRR